MTPPEDVTTDGYKIQLRTTTLGPTLLTQLLLPALRMTAEVNPQTRMVMRSLAAPTSKFTNLHYARALAESKTNKGCPSASQHRGDKPSSFLKKDLPQTVPICCN
ncbi:hypothetical protein ASPBRDRAFT_35452 [Aspergillus brasiliensis CBS 101740]|uniref:Uncharacterized protein n=1 Tax=Aspergillus brasiliensis (strain CBS 101740 / IMI 381727 / IBT 21946) TaxID=767769 RepID=A0A1L9U2Z3_ASPBC|nr:hypothetical protein ASPBRDRAFT_35452 [Aspergillus brasiliensis CBS 101740]